MSEKPIVKIELVAEEDRYHDLLRICEAINVNYVTKHHVSSRGRRATIEVYGRK